ncbi:MAG TPA: hypothetical protein VFE20_09045 [Thermoleophilia bacterium]|nr:hypothetical protein [Thermoleophilia bacterium]
MSKTCYNCGTQNAEAEAFCHTCGASLGRLSDLQKSGIQAGSAEERVLWENGDIQLTTDAVLIGMATDSPDVVPLDTLYDVVLEERCVVLKVKDGDDKYCMLDDPKELAELVKEQMNRPRLAHGRQEMGYNPPE